MSQVAISVVIPVFNEQGSIGQLVADVDTAFAGQPYEIVVVDDASRDDTLAVLQTLKSAHPRLRVLGHTHNAGQSRAIYSGVVAARGGIIVTLDGDGQNPPVDAPALVAALQADPDCGLVQGCRVKRRDTLSKRLASKAANFVRAQILRDGAPDAGCGLKAVRREVFLALPYFDHMHRYMPALVRREGLGVAFHAVGHQARRAGQSNYTNLGRLFAAFSDLWGVRWLGSRRRLTGLVREL